MNHYYTSTGERISQGTLDRRIRRAKQVKLDNFQDTHTHIHCEECKRSDAIKYDMSHTTSIQDAKNMSQTELCYDVGNLRLLCRECHQKHDGLL